MQKGVFWHAYAYATTQAYCSTSISQRDFSCSVACPDVILTLYLKWPECPSCRLVKLTATVGYPAQAGIASLKMDRIKWRIRTPVYK